MVTVVMKRHNDPMSKAYENDTLGFAWSLVPAIFVRTLGTGKEYIGSKGRLRC